MSSRSEPRSVRFLVKALSTSNLTLSGTQTVDTISCGPNDLVAALGQSDNKNAIYFIPASGGAWVPVDPGLSTGVEVYAISGSANVNAVYGCDTTGAITWGTTSTTFTKKSSSGSTFNPAIPGTIGATTPGTLYTADLLAKVYASDVTQPSPVLLFLSLFGGHLTGGTTDYLKMIGPTGDGMSVEFANVTGTSLSRLIAKTITLAPAATASVGTFTHGGIVAVAGWSTSVAEGGLAIVSGNGTIAATGAGTTNFATTDTGSKLCLISGTNDCTVKNNTAGSLTVQILALIGASA